MDRLRGHSLVVGNPVAQIHSIPVPPNRHFVPPSVPSIVAPMSQMVNQKDVTRATCCDQNDVT